MNDFEYISEWLTDAYNNHKELKGYALYHNLNGFIHDAFVEHTVFKYFPAFLKRNAGKIFDVYVVCGKNLLIIEL